LKRDEVMRRTGWSRSKLSEKVKAKEFPEPIRDTPNSPPLWIEAQVEEAIQERIARATINKPTPRPRLRDDHGQYIPETDQPAK
jgi:predicted DNA-binding transcriptional regulator AlpA